MPGALFVRLFLAVFAGLAALWAVSRLWRLVFWAFLITVIIYLLTDGGTHMPAFERLKSVERTLEGAVHR